MDNVRRLNINLTESISALRYFLKNFEVKTRIYKIFFRGKSFDFEGFREYIVGEDDMSFIDWKASNRGNKLLVRQYKEEEEKKILFIVDVGENMVFGSTEKLKCEYSSELVLSLSDLILKNNDKVGMITFNDKVKKYFMPRRSRQQFDVFLDVLSDSRTYGGGSNIEEALEFLMQIFGKSISCVVLVSDFVNFGKKARHALDLVASRYETLAFIVKDPVDKTLPDVSGEFMLENPFTGDQLLVNPKLAKMNYEKYALKQEKYVIDSFKRAGVDYLELSTSNKFAFNLTEFVKGRVRKKVIV